MGYLVLLIDGNLLLEPLVLFECLMRLWIGWDILWYNVRVGFERFAFEFQHATQQRVVFFVRLVLAHWVTRHMLLCVYLLLILDSECFGRHGVSPFIVDRVRARFDKCTLCSCLNQFLRVLSAQCR